LAPSPEQVAGLDGVATGLLLLGFAIKAGLIGVHVWVPLAARSAPAAAGAVVLGAFVMAAAIGWTRFLPIGHEALSDWGFGVAVAGVATMLYVLPVGLVQTDPKTVIGYTSVGLSGVLATLLAVALAEPARAAAAVEALTLFAGYQALSIAALLLGVGLARRVPAARAVPLLAIPALILAGAPYTWGALAHVLADETLLGAGAPWSSVARLAVLGGWFGTGLLTWRVLALVGSERGRSAISGAAISLPWLSLIALLLVTPFLLGLPFPSPATSWPVLAGALLALPIALWHPSWPRRLVGRIPPGDLLVPLAHASSYIWHRTPSLANSLLAALSRVPIRLGVSDPARDSQVERNLALWPVAGTLLLGIATVLLVLLAL
jgi:formate hydrogenlyase subunit 3/multisubunit Na+/H+ antiporter MnhD subunit